MSVEAPHQSKQTQEQDTLTDAQKEWKANHDALWAQHEADSKPQDNSEEASFFESVFNEDVAPSPKAEQVQPSEEKEKGPSPLSRIKASLGALATKISDVFTTQKSGMPQSPEEFKLSHSEATEAASKKPETEKQPRFKLVDIKARAVEIVDRTKYNMGLAKEIGVEVKDILVEKAKDKFDAAKEKALDAKDDAKVKFGVAKDKARDLKDVAIDKVLDAKDVAFDKAGQAKDIGIGLAGYVATEGFEFLGKLIAKSAEFAKDAPNRLSERFTEAAPTPSNPNNRELNRRGKILVLGLGVTAFAGLTYLGRMAGIDHQDGIDLANQVPLDTPGIDTLDTSSGLHTDPLPMVPDTTALTTPETLPGDQLPVSPVSADVMPEAPDTTGQEQKIEFSPEVGTLEAGDNIWDDSMQMLKEGGFNGSEQDLIDRTNALTEWRLKEMGITAEEAKYLPVDTKLPMPDSAAMQEIIARAEQLKG